MQTDELLQTLGYADSPRFLQAEEVDQAPQHAQAFRRAFRDCGVRGVYLLRDDASGGAPTPAVYVAEAASADAADEIHRKVWNQNVVPFLLVRTPNDVRLYSGFQYRPPDASTTDAQRGVLEASVAFVDVLDRLRDLRASAIDNGVVWRTLGERIDPATRVDSRLLDNLKELGRWLREPGADGTKLSAGVAHALIGKFVYLRYLRDRDILSDWKLEDLGIEHDSVFSRNATVKGVQALVKGVDGWLNGSVFPFPFSGKDAPGNEHVRRVAGVFLGDDPVSGQLHLDFQAYDFSFIPIETLSVIYEQFLSAEDENREKGAYYTPIHLVNFMLAELDGMRRLEPGRTVLDPSCGSGAFLVQCYRRLVELHLASGGKQTPGALRDVLEQSIFGVDRDQDACQVTALSLLLAMLDYVDPPDLHKTRQFKLPDLVGRNIFVGDFFDAVPGWATRRYDWVVGNPPWLQVKNDPVTPVRMWMNDHASTHPVTNNEIAEAFAWKAMEHVSEQGAVGLLLPAMTLYKDSPAFRARYFAVNDVAAVANFTNFRRDLFVKAETPAAACFTWGLRNPGAEGRERVAVFSPFVANQETNRTQPGSRHEPWTITVDHSELQQLARDAICDGDTLPWKVAMWGGPRDMHLLRSVRALPTLDALVKTHDLKISEGARLREGPGAGRLTPITELVGRNTLDMWALKNRSPLYSLPPDALAPLSAQSAFIENRTALDVCRPPHVIVSATRSFAVFSDDFVFVPSRQIGIAGAKDKAPLLKSIALFLSSDFARYHQFFLSPQSEFRGGLSTLATLRLLPTPLDDLSADGITAWAKLYDELATTQRELWLAKAKGDGPRRVVDTTPLETHIDELGATANAAVAKLLGLRNEEQVLVHDLVHVRRRMADGLVPDQVVRRPETNELDAYARRLERTLDRAIDDRETRRHDVAVVADGASGMVRIELRPEKPRTRRRVFDATDDVVKSFAQIRKRMQRERGQWLYFDRNLVLFDGPRTFILKPLQRLWWTESQALADADHVVAEALAPEEGAE